MNAGSGIGLLHVYTAGATFTGLYLKTGTNADVKGTGSPASFVAATSIDISAVNIAARVGTGSRFDLRLFGRHERNAFDFLEQRRAVSDVGRDRRLRCQRDLGSRNQNDDVRRSESRTNRQPDGYDESPAYAHDCSGKRVTDLYNGSVTQIVRIRHRRPCRACSASYVASIAAQAHFDALFEDDSGALSAFAPYDPFSSMPCNYTDASWITGEIALNQASSLPIMVNGLSGLNGHNLSLAIGILAGSNTMGGVFEQCYDSVSTAEDGRMALVDD